MENIDVEVLSKTKDGRKKIMETFAKMIDQSDLKTSELVYWSYYHNMFDDDQFDYLRKVGMNEFPATVRNIPFHRSFINLLVSKQSKRGFPFQISTADVKSKELKYYQKLQRQIDIFINTANKKMILANQQISMIDQQFQQIQQALSVEPENEEMAQQQMEIIQQLPSIQMDMEMAKEMLKKEITLNQAELEQNNKYFKYEYKDFKDIAATYLLLKLRQEGGLEKKGVKNFISHIVTGREYYYVDYLPGIKNPLFVPMNGMKITYPSIETIEWTQDAPWVIIDENWSYNSILGHYGHLLTDTEKEELTSFGFDTASKGAFIPLQGTKAVLADDHRAKFMRRENPGGTGISVKRFFWKSSRKLRAIQKTDKDNKSKTYTHFIDADKDIIIASDYYYNSQTKKWINKKAEDIQYGSKEVEVLNELKGDILFERYYEERYDGVCINNSIWKSWKSPVQLRSEDDYTKVPLPVIGKTFNGMSDYPYSLIAQTIPLVDTMKILYYHRELLLALTNIEGVVLDYSQKPATMTEDEWYYQMKLGRYIIQTVVNGQQVSSFNQFQRVGGSAHSIIQYLDNMIANTYNLMGELMGIARPSKGQIAPTDQVGTFERAIDQSDLITQIIYEEHDEIMAKALTILSNLKIKYSLINEELVTVGGNELDVFKLDPDFFRDVDLECRVDDTILHEHQLQELKTIIKQRSDVGQIPLQHFVTLYMSQSVREIERTVQYFAEEAEKAAAMQFSNNEQSKAEAQERMMQLKSELDQKMEVLKTDLLSKQKEYDNVLDTMKLENDKAAKQADAMLKQDDLNFKREKMQVDSQLKLMELLNENSVETSLISENRDARLIDQKINALKLKMEALINGVNLEMTKVKTKNEHKQAMKKLEVEEKKARKMPVEHVNDN